MPIWKCPGCDNTIEQGSLTCGRCCCAMRLERDQESDGNDGPEIDRLVEKADAADLKPEALDELVHDLAASIASGINNSGVEDQIRYLAKEMGLKSTEKQLDQIIEHGTDREEE